MNFTVERDADVTVIGVDDRNTIDETAQYFYLWRSDGCTPHRKLQQEYLPC